MSKYKKPMMRTAIIWSEESYCNKRKVGAVVERDGHILDTGYNGTVAGTDNECEDEYYECNYCKKREESMEQLAYGLPKSDVFHPIGMDILVSCKHCRETIAIFNKWNKIMDRQTDKDMFKKVYVTNAFTIHAEQNIITNCAKAGISLKGATMYVTTSPCETCAKLIAGSGIVSVYYATEYKDLSGVKYLNSLGIQTELYDIKTMED